MAAAVFGWLIPQHAALPLAAFTCAASGLLLLRVQIPFVGFAGTALPLLMTPGTDDAAAPAGDPGAACAPRALFVEMHPPPPSVARSLRLSAGQSAAVVTVRFDDLAQDRPAALAITVLRPDLFRIVVESPAGFSRRGTDGSFSGAWTRALQDWEP